jgi:secreted trypsin-like serine protease
LHSTRNPVDAHKLKKSLENISDFEKCGRNINLDGNDFENISTGNESAKPGEYPWMVSYGQLDENGIWVHSCGGSIISHSHILTAFHCFRELDYTDNQKYILALFDLNH